MCEDLTKQGVFAWGSKFMKLTGFAGFLYSLFSLLFPSFAIKMSLYLLVEGGYFHMEIYIQLSGEQKKSMLFASAVSQISFSSVHSLSRVRLFVTP